MSTLVELATQAIITPVIEKIASQEGLEPEIIRQRIVESQIVAPADRWDKPHFDQEFSQTNASSNFR